MSKRLLLASLGLLLAFGACGGSTAQDSEGGAGAGVVGAPPTLSPNGGAASEGPASVGAGRGHDSSAGEGASMGVVAGNDGGRSPDTGAVSSGGPGAASVPDELGVVVATGEPACRWSLPNESGCSFTSLHTLARLADATLLDPCDSQLGPFKVSSTSAVDATCPSATAGTALAMQPIAFSSALFAHRDVFRRCGEPPDVTAARCPRRGHPPGTDKACRPCRSSRAGRHRSAYPSRTRSHP